LQMSNQCCGRTQPVVLAEAVPLELVSESIFGNEQRALRCSKALALARKKLEI